jgi:hypothetical protein
LQRTISRLQVERTATLQFCETGILEEQEDDGTYMCSGIVKCSTLQGSLEDGTSYARIHANMSAHAQILTIH